jgi:hypothetical protein
VKIFFLLITLLCSLPVAAEASAPELVCDPDARVSFHSRWIRESTVSLDALGEELPWTGKEPLTTGERLKAKAQREAGARTPEELLAIDDSTHFVTFQSPDSSHTLYVERILLDYREQDGLVVTHVTREGDESRFATFHCVSR